MTATFMCLTFMCHRGLTSCRANGNADEFGRFFNRPPLLCLSVTGKSHALPVYRLTERERERGRKGGNAICLSSRDRASSCPSRLSATRGARHESLVRKVRHVERRRGAGRRGASYFTPGLKSRAGEPGISVVVAPSAIARSRNASIKERAGFRRTNSWDRARSARSDIIPGSSRIPPSGGRKTSGGGGGGWMGEERRDRERARGISMSRLNRFSSTLN